MAVRITAMAALLVLFVCSYGEASSYTVGDSQQWGFSVNYTTWASTKTFLVGDTLEFKYTDGEHNVLEVSQSAYDSCLTTNPTKEYTGGSTSISLTTEGTRYFICGITGHCTAGMKVAVTVSAGTPTTPAAPSPSTNTAPAPTSAGNVSQMKDVLLLLFLSASLLMSAILA